MGFLELLEEAGEISEGTFIKFLHQYKTKKKDVHFFFEGLDDQSFYVNHIESIYPSDYRFYYYVCNGKEFVYQIYKDIEWTSFNRSRVLFFVDKDLDDILKISQIEDQNIFVTGFYSIENYLVTSDVFSRLLRETCFLNDDQTINFLIDKFESQLTTFSKLMTRISAWVVYCRRNDLDVNLNEIEIDKIFEINKELKVRRKVKSGHKTPFEYICSATKTTHYHLREIMGIVEELRKIPSAKIFIRGKYELWFLYAFYIATIDSIIPEINQRIKEINKLNRRKLPKCKVTISIRPENILQISAPRVRIPGELRSFLLANVKALVA